MYYTWSWWWFMSWVIPMLLLAWVVFGWTERRSLYRGDYLQRRDEPRSDRGSRGGVAGLNRGRGPLNYMRPDARIFEDVCEQLTLDEQLDASAIEVDVDGGIVQLRGRVESRYDKRRAEAIADSVLGARDVDNKLEIGKLSAAPAVDNPTPVAQQS